jgi:hypothetical protein
MSITVVIHTEDKEKLTRLFRVIENSKRKDKLSIYLHSKGYFPWEDEWLKNQITTFNSYNAFSTDKSKIDSIIDIITKIKGGDVLIFDEDCKSFNLTPWDTFGQGFLFCKRSEIIDLNLDSKYENINSFFIDLKSQKNKKPIFFNDGSVDSIRYNKKLENPLFFEKIIYVDGGLGDHIMALPLLERIGKEVYVSCKYESLFQHIPVKGFVSWIDDLFGGYRRFVYEYGSTNNSPTIIDAFFEMYGYNRKESDVLKYNGVRESADEIPIGKTALICTSAAKIQGLDSNKDWRDIRWMKLVNELQKKDFYVIQVGTSGDNQIPNVNQKFLDQPISKLATVVDKCTLWISVDTFFHHFAASVKPNSGICITPFYNDHAKHPGVTYVEKNCGKNYFDRRWWMDLQQPERKECMDMIQVEDVLSECLNKTSKIKINNLSNYSDLNLNNLIVKKILTVENSVLDSIDLSKYQERRNISKLPEHWFFMTSGSEHYRLLCYISSLFNDEIFIDIGTYVGSSALALGYNKNNKVISFDIIRQSKDTQGIIVNVDESINDENIKFKIGDVFEYDKTIILSSPLIFLDTKHDGIFEEVFYNFLINEKYKGILMLDDINLNDEMKQFWNKIKNKKFDISNIGHWSGTGLVVFE